MNPTSPKDIYTPSFFTQLREKEKNKEPSPAGSASEPISSPQEAPLVRDPLEVTSPPAPPPKNGLYEIKDDKGALLQRIPYKEGKIEGSLEIYSSLTQKLIQKIGYVEGVLQGSLISYDEEGRMTQQISYEKGKQDGLSTSYMEGLKLSEMMYKNGVLEGPSIFYGPEEYVATISNYVQGKLDGEVIIFDSRKNILRKSFYKAGQLEGTSTTFFASGKVFEEAFYKQDIPQGQIKQYYEDGTLMSIDNYDQKGILLSEERYNEKGEKTSTQDISQVPPEEYKKAQAQIHQSLTT